MTFFVYIDRSAMTQVMHDNCGNADALRSVSLRLALSLPCAPLSYTMTQCSTCQEDVTPGKEDSHRRACSQASINIRLFDVTSRNCTEKYLRKISRQEDGYFHCPTLNCGQRYTIPNSFSRHARDCDERVGDVSPICIFF